MARVDFYLLRAGGREDAARFACRLVEKAWLQGNRVFVSTEGEESARRFDELLWTFREDSFVPHSLAGEPDAESEAVTVGGEPSPRGGHEVLVNLSGRLPAEHCAFARIAEIVDADETTRAAARCRYAAYRGEGHDLQHHDIAP